MKGEKVAVSDSDYILFLIAPEWRWKGVCYCESETKDDRISEIFVSNNEIKAGIDYFKRIKRLIDFSVKSHYTTT